MNTYKHTVGLDDKFLLLCDSFMKTKARYIKVMTDLYSKVEGEKVEVKGAVYPSLPGYEPRIKSVKTHDGKTVQFGFQPDDETWEFLGTEFNTMKDVYQDFFDLYGQDDPKVFLTKYAPE